jgi:hypothetical protein
MDLPQLFENICIELGYIFSYGNNANKNLIDNGFNKDDVYFLLDPISRNKTKSEFSGNGLMTYSGNFMFVMNSELNENYNDKYKYNILPLLSKLEDFEYKIECNNYQINNWDSTEIIDFLDANFDGFIISFNISKL